MTIKGASIIIKAIWLRITYRIALLKLRRVSKKRKLKAIFLISEPSKWKSQRLYDALLASKCYDPYVSPTIMDIGFLPEEEHQVKLEQCTNFFMKRGLRVLPATDAITHKPLPLIDLNPDMVFYQQPWGIAKCQMPDSVASRALAFYVPYNIPCFAVHCHPFISPLGRLVYASFIENEQWKRYCCKYAGWLRRPSNLVALGNPIREDIASGVAEKGLAKCVIYAPHWSFRHPGNVMSDNSSTFLQFGSEILTFAKKHPEVKWIFKPHPCLGPRLVESGAMSKMEVETYYKEWETIGTASYDGNYIDLFYQSSAMITDSCSFLTEYAMTNKPIIRLVPKPDVEYAPPCKNMISTYYEVSDFADMDKVFNDIIIRGVDPKREIRLSRLKELGYNRNDISIQLLKFLDTIIR